MHEYVEIGSVFQNNVIESWNYNIGNPFLVATKTS